MKEIHANTAYKILSIALAKGEKMPEHYASSDAVLILEKGKVKLHLPERDVMLAQGDTFHITASAPHSLQVLEDFSAFVVLAAGAQVRFTDL